MLEPLGQSQVLQYLKLLSKNYGYSFHLITYEKKEDFYNTSKVHDLKTELEQLKIYWHPLLYHKRLSVLSTSFDIIKGILLARRLSRMSSISLVHSRSYVSSVIGLNIATTLNIPHIFDMRGFWPEEKVDSGSWGQDSLLFRVAKFFEKKFLTESHAVISLTHAAVDLLKMKSFIKQEPSKFYVIPTCTNLELFKPNNDSFQKKTSMVMGYLGNATNWYNFEPVIYIFKELKKHIPHLTLSIINKDDHKHIISLLRKHKVSAEDYSLEKCDHKDVPEKIKEMDFTAFFIRPTYSKIASAPTKLGEFLASGVPCITTPGVGDLDKIILESGVGVILDDTSSKAVEDKIEQILGLVMDDGVKAKCVATAKSLFSLETGVNEIHKIYRNLSR